MKEKRGFCFGDENHWRLCSQLLNQSMLLAWLPRALLPWSPLSMLPRGAQRGNAVYLNRDVSKLKKHGW